MPSPKPMTLFIATTALILLFVCANVNPVAALTVPSAARLQRREAHIVDVDTRRDVAPLPLYSRTSFDDRLFTRTPGRTPSPARSKSPPRLRSSLSRSKSPKATGGRTLSRSPSPRRAASKAPSRGRSKSPTGNSRSRSPLPSTRGRSKTRASASPNRSRSRSPLSKGKARVRSPSPATRGRSKTRASASPNRSRSRSPLSKGKARARSPSPVTRGRSRERASASPNRSRSPSPSGANPPRPLKRKASVEAPSASKKVKVEHGVVGGSAGQGASVPVAPVKPDTATTLQPCTSGFCMPQTSKTPAKTYSKLHVANAALAAIGHFNAGTQAGRGNKAVGADGVTPAYSRKEPHAYHDFPKDGQTAFQANELKGQSMTYPLKQGWNGNLKAQGEDRVVLTKEPQGCEWSVAGCIRHDATGDVRGTAVP